MSRIQIPLSRALRHRASLGREACRAEQHRFRAGRLAKGQGVLAWGCQMRASLQRESLSRPMYLAALIRFQDTAAESVMVTAGIQACRQARSGKQAGAVNQTRRRSTFSCSVSEGSSSSKGWANTRSACGNNCCREAVSRSPGSEGCDAALFCMSPLCVHRQLA